MKTLSEWWNWFDVEAKNVVLVDRAIVEEILSGWQDSVDDLESTIHELKNRGKGND